jgi:hypothetical protein
MNTFIMAIPSLDISPLLSKSIMGLPPSTLGDLEILGIGVLT